MSAPKFIRSLESLLSQELPGWQAQRLIKPAGRKILPSTDGLVPAAVLIALFKERGEWVFPLIKRTHDGFAHSGQIALPGGRQERRETNIETALREAWEEVNVDQNKVQVVGELTSLPIPVSRFLVHPIVGWLEEAPRLVPEPREVAEVFTTSLSELTRTPISIETREIRGKVWDIPYLEINGHKVWGATAMILSEFRALLEKAELPLSQGGQDVPASPI